MSPRPNRNHNKNPRTPTGIKNTQHAKNRSILTAKMSSLMPGCVGVEKIPVGVRGLEGAKNKSDSGWGAGTFINAVRECNINIRQILMF
jgi:hypothetical protein